MGMVTWLRMGATGEFLAKAKGRAFVARVVKIRQEDIMEYVLRDLGVLYLIPSIVCCI
jgi:hypothetical protein